MRLFQKAPDGGKNSGVTGYFLIEIKSLFSIVILHFRDAHEHAKEKGPREAYHSHAFNAWTLWLWGRVVEQRHKGTSTAAKADEAELFQAGQLKYTPRDNIHRIQAIGDAWAISIRGPWIDTWKEFNPRTQNTITLTHGRKEII